MDPFDLLGAKNQRSEALFRAYGRFVEGLGGRYITAEDVGTDVRCMEWVRMETSHVTGISRALGGAGAVGYYLIKHLAEEGATVTVCDIDEERLDRVRREFGVATVDPEQIYD